VIEDEMKTYPYPVSYRFSVLDTEGLTSFHIWSLLDYRKQKKKLLAFELFVAQPGNSVKERFR